MHSKHAKQYNNTFHLITKLKCHQRTTIYFFSHKHNRKTVECARNPRIKATEWTIVGAKGAGEKAISERSMSLSRIRWLTSIVDAVCRQQSLETSSASFFNTIFCPARFLLSHDDVFLLTCTFSSFQNLLPLHSLLYPAFLSALVMRFCQTFPFWRSVS